MRYNLLQKLFGIEGVVLDVLNTGNNNTMIYNVQGNGGRKYEIALLPSLSLNPGDYIRFYPCFDNTGLIRKVKSFRNLQESSDLFQEKLPSK